MMKAAEYQKIIMKNKKYIFLLVIIVSVLLFIYIDKLFFFGNLYFEKYKYSRDDYPFMYIIPNDRIRYISNSYCLNDEKESWGYVNYKQLNMLVPSHGQYDKGEKVDSHILSIIYDDGGVFSVFTSSIDKNIFKPNIEESGDDYYEIIQHFNEYTKLDVLEYVLSSSPDDLSIVNNLFLLSLKVIALEIKRGMVPDDVTNIEKIFINKNIRGFVVKVMSKSSKINVAYIYNDKLDHMYQVNFLNISDEKVNCVLKSISD